MALFALSIGWCFWASIGCWIMLNSIISALNAAIGDYLVLNANPLGITMGFRLKERSLQLDREGLLAAYPQPTAALAIFVHGLGCNEDSWQYASERLWGE